MALLHTDHAQAPRLVILDTDPGVDDAMALFCLARQPGAVLHSITTVFGNAAVEITTRNASYLVQRFGLNLPVHAGAAAPLAGARHVPDLHVHGKDGFGDTGAAAGHVPPPSGKPAWLHLVDTIAEYPGRVTIVAIAPLTNLALALRHRPEIATLVDEVIVMGGAFGTHGRHGNLRPHAEANFFYDPLAADEVLAARWPVTVVGLDVTSDCILSSAQARALPVLAGDVGRFLHAISRGYEQIYHDFDGIDGCCIHDVAAAMIVADRSLFEIRSGILAVSTAPERAGQSTLVSAAASECAGRPAQRYCVGVEADALVSAFLAMLAGYGSEQP